MTPAVTLILATVIAACTYCVHWYRTGWGISPGGISPDGQFYLAMAEGRRVPSPYCRRGLLPTMLGAECWRWIVLSAVSLVACGPLLVLYVPGTPEQKLTAVWLFCWLPGIFGLNVRLPVLVDAPSFALALASAVAWQRGHHAMSLSLALLSTLCKESGGVFAAVFAMTPWLAIPALLFPAFQRLVRVIALESDISWLAHPWREARNARDVLGWRPLLLPWGMVALLTALGAGWDRATLCACIALAIGYGQLLIAQDHARLFQWASPAVLVLAVRTDVGMWLVPVLVAHVFVANSWRGA